VEPIAVCRLDHDRIRVRRRGRRQKQRVCAAAEVTREQQPHRAAAFRQLEEDAGRAENMSGVHERRADAGGEIDRLAIAGTPLERLDGLECVSRREQGLRRLVIRAVSRRPMRAWVRIRIRLVLQVSGVQHDQPGELAGGAGRDDLAAKPALGQQRQAPAMIEVGVRQQHDIDAGGIEAEVAGVFLGELAAALKEAAIDQDAPTGAFDEMA
jgi:hypothetical protein